MNIKSKVLKNGLKIYAVNLNDNSGVASVNTFYKVGSSYEELGKSGIAHLLEHLSFKSTKTHKAGEFDEIIKALGGVNNACTSFDYTQYYVNIANIHIKRVLELYSSMMSELLFNKDEFYKERDVVLEEERLRVGNDAFGYLYNAIYNYAFIKTSYHWTPIGFADDIANLTPKIVKEFYTKFYAPNNACIVISGDLANIDIFSMCEEIFSKKSAKKITQNKVYEPDRTGLKEIELSFPNLNSNIFACAYKIPAFNHEDFEYLKAISIFLNLDKNSIIKNKMINEYNLCADLDFYAQSSKNENLFIIFGVCNDLVNTKSAIKQLKKLINQTKFNKFDTRTIYNQLELSINQVKSNPSALASGIGKFECFGDVNVFLNSLTSKELDYKILNQVFKKYLKDDNLTQIILKEKV